MTTLRNGPIDTYTPPLAVHRTEPAPEAASTALAVVSNTTLPVIRDTFQSTRNAPARTWLGFLGAPFRKPQPMKPLHAVAAALPAVTDRKEDWDGFDAAFATFERAEPEACPELATYLIGELDNRRRVPLKTFLNLYKHLPLVAEPEPARGPEAGPLDVDAKASAVILLNELMGSLGRDEPYGRNFDIPRFEAFMRSATSPKRTDVERAMLGQMAGRIKAASTYSLPLALWRDVCRLEAMGKAQTIEAHDEATRLLGSIDGYTGYFYSAERMGWRDTSWGHTSDFPRIGQLAATLSFKLDGSTHRDALR